MQLLRHLSEDCTVWTVKEIRNVLATNLEDTPIRSDRGVYQNCQLASPRIILNCGLIKIRSTATEIR